MRALILFVLIGAAFAGPRSPQRIVGGESTVIQQYPFMSNIQYPRLANTWTQWCGGTLVTTMTIATAAHCFDYDGSPWSYRVRLGTSFASSGGTVHQVAELIVHEGYFRFDNDAAIVRLATPARLSATIATARIAGPKYDNLLPDGTTFTAIGWGHLTSDGFSPEQLQRVEVNLINHELCAERYAYLKTQPGYQNWPDVTDSMLCTGILDVGGKDACQGDSGGPLIHARDVIVGITSWGYTCAHDFYPGVNARVPYLSDWIAQHGSITN